MGNGSCASSGKRPGSSVSPTERFCVEGDDADRVWSSLHDEAGKSDASYFGYAGARSRFLKFFPDGFRDESYAVRERGYKVAAKTKLDGGAPLESALDGSGLGEAVLSAYRATNLLSPYEKTRLQDILRGSEADAFICAAAAFTLEPTKATLVRLDAILKPHRCANWTIATYLPYFWRPDEHMFLKPRVTQDFAARVGHPFADLYEARLDIEVYRSLLDLAAKTEAHISDLGPKDRIDLQSFIWTVGEYSEEFGRVGAAREAFPGFGTD